ncbi:GGDEF domain-containing protein [Agathobacter sp.]|uniref:GGDEF domain-containing protein n=1 Tax=Agathobacter sp. TaxID=2021311 RepID=UPI003FD6F1EE
MAGISLLSICFYFLAFSLAKSEKLSIYVYSVAIEILISMVFSVVCLGLTCNFQLFLIDAMFFIFAMDYMVLRKKNKNHIAILFCCVYAIALILLYTIDGFYTPLYELAPVVSRSISISILSIAVILIIICMMYLLQFMSSEEGAMEKQAQFDALTEIPNRFFMMAKLKYIFEADNQGDYYLAMIDIDDFKKINDSFGHNVGDDALKILARTIVNKARGVELSYCRWGGEEFLLLGKCVNGEVPKNFLDELRVEINSKTFWTSKGSGRMTVTIGAGKYKVGQDYKEWINFVDKQLYVGKCTGKNKVVC